MTTNINRQWKVVPDENGCGTIYLRDDIPFFSRMKIRWLKRMTVLEFHRMIQDWLGSDEGSKYDDATSRSDFRITDELEKKIDRVFQLQGTWDIDKKSLRALRKGPLLNPNGTKIMVPAHGLVATFFNWVDDSPVRKAIGMILPFILFLLK